jgi:hypothetical protein
MTSVALPPGLDDASAAGWDSRTVWQERVRNPRLAAMAAPSTPRIVLEDRSAGWKPIETWRLLVHRPRKQPR